MRKFEIKQTRDGKARALPLNEALWGLFTGLRTRPEVPWVFHPAGHRWTDVRHGFERACEAAGLTDFHFHDLRAPYLCVLAHYARGTARYGEQPSRAYVADHDPPLCPLIP
ncbi:MAG: hypothetical protein KF876_12120 [Nitrospira sp.]|nr:hypothetical protein [Nitrospira sp.]